MDLDFSWKYYEFYYLININLFVELNSNQIMKEYRQSDEMSESRKESGDEDDENSRNEDSEKP